MSRAQIKARALELVGQGYIYGAKGQTCSEAFRRQQADQYPAQAAHILWEGAKWDGKPVWDCAQLTRECARAGGVTLVSGATSQWTKTAWARKGEIATLPTDEVVFLYRQSGDRMQHTGVYLGDGTEVDARGTSYGVVHQPVSQYAWTHWASPWAGPQEEQDKEDEDMAVLYRAIVTTEKDPLRVREAQETGRIIGKVPKGRTVEVLSEGDWPRIRYGETVGYASAAYLTRVEEEPDDGKLSIDDVIAECAEVQIVIRDSEGHVFRPVGAYTTDIEIVVD